MGSDPHGAAGFVGAYTATLHCLSYSRRVKQANNSELTSGRPKLRSSRYHGSITICRTGHVLEVETWVGKVLHYSYNAQILYMAHELLTDGEYKFVTCDIWGGQIR